jgi:hypothetical protein
MKRYSIKRIGLFNLLAEFPGIVLMQAGPLFVEGIISEDDSKLIEKKYPGSIWPWTP